MIRRLIFINIGASEGRKISKLVLSEHHLSGQSHQIAQKSGLNLGHQGNNRFKAASQGFI